MANSQSSFKDIYFPDACSSDWQKMTKSSSGGGCDRFCSKCEKTVHDFSDRTFEEFKELYDATNGEVCIKIQRERVGVAPLNKIKRSLLGASNLVRAGVVSVVTFLGISHTVQSQDTNNQNKKPATELAHASKFSVPDTENTIAELSSQSVKGILYRGNNKKSIIKEDLEVELYINGTLRGSIYAENGRFDFKEEIKVYLSDKVEIRVIVPKEMKGRRGLKTFHGEFHPNETKNLHIPMEYNHVSNLRIIPLTQGWVGCPKFR